MSVVSSPHRYWPNREARQYVRDFAEVSSPHRYCPNQGGPRREAEVPHRVYPGFGRWIKPGHEQRFRITPRISSVRGPPSTPQAFYTTAGRRTTASEHDHLVRAAQLVIVRMPSLTGMPVECLVPDRPPRAGFAPGFPGIPVARPVPHQHAVNEPIVIAEQCAMTRPQPSCPPGQRLRPPVRRRLSSPVN